MNDFKLGMKNYAEKAEQALDQYLPMDDTSYSKVTQAMRYSLLGGGKRIRACLVMWVYEELGGETKDVLPFASAIEMVHAYSLIHDDLPCMDNDDMRRGKPSCHVEFGESTALLAGDALLTHAFTTMLTKGLATGIAPQRVAKAAGVLAEAAGYTGMVGGQIMDLANEEKTVALDAVKETNRLKTGKLILAACKMGAILGGASQSFVDEISSYAQNIGIAFQIADDILDATADAQVMGKPTGRDAENHKSTYVTLLGVDDARKMAEKFIEDAKTNLNVAGVKSTVLYDLADMMINRAY